MQKNSTDVSKIVKSHCLCFVIFLGLAAITFSGCSGSSDSDSSGSSTAVGIYPMYLDNNANGRNDYMESGTHVSGAVAKSSIFRLLFGVKEALADTGFYNHSFADGNGDGICDYAQNGSNTWHGPGFIDENGNGACDYWEAGSQQYNRNGGIRYQDQNSNRINDYYESSWHYNDHGFADGNGDGICDYAQNGSNLWHGPGFIDGDSNGVCDYWQAGGSGPGYGRGYGHGHRGW